MTTAETVVAFDADCLEGLWGDVPDEFRTWTYDLSCPPFDRALRGRRARVVVLPVDGLSETVCREIAWWVWWCQERSNRRPPVDVIQHLVAAVGHIDGKHPRGPLTRSLVDPQPGQLLRAFRQTYHDHYGRLPGPHLVRVFADEVRFFRFAFRLQYSPLDWWQHDVWSPRQDPRIPLRPHEPLGAQNLSFVNIEPAWLRESLKFYGRVSLESGELTWGTIMQRVFHVGSYLGGFVAARGLTGPALCDQPEDQLRALMLDYQSYLRGRRATRRGSQAALAPFTVRQAQISLRGFYFFLVDHRHEVTAATGDRRFLELGPAHLRLWRRSDLARRRRHEAGSSPDAYIGDHDLGQMIEHVELLGMPATESKTVVRDDAPVTVGGLGDPPQGCVYGSCRP